VLTALGAITASNVWILLTMLIRLPLFASFAASNASLALGHRLIIAKHAHIPSILTINIPVSKSAALTVGMLTQYRAVLNAARHSLTV